MKKLFSFFAAMLVAVAVNAQTDFADPGYACAADDAVLTGGSSSNFFLKTDVTPHCVAWSDVSLSSNALATWTINASRGCYVTVSLDLGPVISSNKHNFEVTIKDAGGNSKGMVTEGGENTASEQVKELDGTILLPAAGIYTVEVYNNRDWGKGTIKNVILKYAADAPSEIIEVESIELNKSELALEIEEVELLAATVLPEDAFDPSVTWVSDNEEVATVSQTGLVTALAEGSAIITATAGHFFATCVVTVSAEKTIPDVNFAEPCVLSGKKAHLEGAIWKNDEYSLYGNGASHADMGNAFWTINVTKPCTVSGVVHGVTHNGHKFILDVFDSNNDSITSIESSADTKWWVGDIALEGTLTFAAAGTYTLRLRNTVAWSSAVYAGVTLTKVPEPKTLYLKPGPWYYAGNGEKFAMYAWSEGKEAIWSEYMTLAENETDIWTGTLPAGYDNVIFVRFGSASTTPSWEDNMWNQTEDLTITDENDLYTITYQEPWSEETGNHKAVGEWSKYEYIPVVPATFYITGNDALVGETLAWHSDAIKATEDSYTFENLPAGYYQLKVLPTGDWSNNKGYDDLTIKADGLTPDNDRNICFTLAEAGDVVVTYIEGETPVFTVEGNFYIEEPVVELPVVALAGTMNGWSTTANILTPAEDSLSASITVALEAMDYELKMVVDGHWLAKSTSYELHRGWPAVEDVDQEIAMGPNIILKADMAGNYTFTWTYATNKLEVTFPAQDTTAIDTVNEPVQPIKRVHNGTIIIERDNKVYSILGLRL